MLKVSPAGVYLMKDKNENNRAMFKNLLTGNKTKN